MTLQSDSNLFTAFNNIEEIKKEKAKVVRTEEMIKVIKETYNYNAPMLASILKTGTQSVYNWENGSRPSIRHFNKIKELYDGIVNKGKTSVLEQPEIANKEIIEDVTAGTPFIELNKFNTKYVNNLEPFYVNIHEIAEILNGELGGSLIRFCNDGLEFRTPVEEEPEEVLELIRNKLKENEKN